MKQQKRWTKELLKEALKHRRVIILAGPRQCGKTTLAKDLSTKDTTYVTLDDTTLLAAAQTDPHGFIKHERKLMIIDEVQQSPQLLLAIKKAVDENTRPGQYLLTGSANIQALPSTQESLAGRVKKIRLRPFSQGELLQGSPSFLKHAFNQKFNYKFKQFDRTSLIHTALQGGFPEVIPLNPKQQYSWHHDYIEALLERDLQDIANIKRKDAMKQLLYSLAAWSSKFMDISNITSTLSIKRPTVENYINILETLYLIEKLEPWTKTDYDRIGKQTKIFMSDSGLMSSLLKWKQKDILYDSDKIGKLIETFIFNELSTQIDQSDHEYSLYHYRDREKREIDFLVERDDGSLLGIEVKAASAITQDDFKHLNWFKNNIAKKTPFIGIVLYSGEHPAPFGKNMWAIPTGALWPL